MKKNKKKIPLHRRRGRRGGAARMPFRKASL